MTNEEASGEETDSNLGHNNSKTANTVSTLSNSKGGVTKVDPSQMILAPGGYLTRTLNGGQVTITPVVKQSMNAPSTPDNYDTTNDEMYQSVIKSKKSG